MMGKLLKRIPKDRIYSHLERNRLVSQSAWLCAVQDMGRSVDIVHMNLVRHLTRYFVVR